MIVYSTDQEKSNNDDSSKWEIVYKNSERWNELGFSLKFGDGRPFPGYGKLYDGEFGVWYCDIGSTEKKNIQFHKERFSYSPEFHRIVGNNINFEQLTNTRGYEALFSGIDNKNNKRWYFALLK